MPAQELQAAKARLANPVGLDAELIADIAGFFNDPEAFVRYTFPWGKAGTPLANETGPDVWQVEVMRDMKAALLAGNDVQAAIQIAVASGHGVGKALAHGEPVLTPAGWVPIEQLRVGDQVMAADGTATRVCGVYAQGRRPLFRVEMSDGSSVLADGEHRWLTTTRADRKRGRAAQVRTTIEIAASLTFPNGPVPGLNHQIPVAQAIAHPHADLPVEPYLLGVWLGHGCAAHRSISGDATEFELLEAAGADLCPPQLDSRQPERLTRTVRRVAPLLRLLGLEQCREHEKFIPRAYLHADIAQRTALLQGLLDATGSANGHGALVFEVTAPGLADGMAELARSLGAVVRRSGKPGQLNGIEHRWVYRLYISLPAGAVPFRRADKLARYVPHWGAKNCDRTRRRFIRAVLPAGSGEATCIAVEHPSHLFITRDHIVTHNTSLVAWVILWFMSTRDFPQVVVTANTKTQLTTKTWRELSKWHKLAINRDWFSWTATKFFHVLYPEVWFAAAIPWTEHNSEAFAGTHEKHVLVIFDEASAVADKIWEVTEGAMTTPGAMWLAFGNPTQNTGRFAQCFGKFKHRWIGKQIDSRTAKMANRAQIQKWIDDYGEDHDFVRVRVRGVFPRAGSVQFIGLDIVSAAMKRKAEGYRDFAKIMGVDVARHGDDQSVSTRRQGNHIWPQRKYRISDLMQLADVIAGEIHEFKPDAVFIDATGMGWGVIDRLRQMGFGKLIFPVQVGEKATNEARYVNKRSELWGLGKEWLAGGGCLPEDPELETDFTGPQYGYDVRMRIEIESKDDMKARGLASPDCADSILLTFASPIAPATKHPASTWRTRLGIQRTRGSADAA